MKEYWVNVYPNLIGIKHYSIYYGIAGALYRLHVREFETREAKELYLKMKYGNPSIIALRNSNQYKAGIFR